MRRPSHLYKYRSLVDAASSPTALTPAAISEAMVCESQLYLAPPSSFEDERDGQPLIPTPEQALLLGDNLLARIIRELPTDPTVLPTLKAFCRWFTDAAFGICSLTDHPRNEAMWRKYSADHGGICVEFDFTVLDDFVTNTKGFKLQPAEYVDKLEPIFQPFLKLQELSFEKEWRLLRDYDVPEWFPSPDRRLRLPDGAIVGVLVGRNATPRDKVKVAEWCARRGLPEPTYLTA